MLRIDFHTHTTFCDGKSTPREMVEAAYRMGMTDFGVSGHADFSMFEPGFGMDDEKLRQYTEELQELREEYRGKDESLYRDRAGWTGTGAESRVRDRLDPCAHQGWQVCLCG